MGLLAAVQGCALPPAPMGAGALKQQREAGMNAQWVQRRLSELERAQGRRPLILDIPGGGQPPGLVVVFGRDPASGCLDVFVIEYGRDPVIRSYVCR